jgi:signal transduction histidine kinase
MLLRYMVLGIFSFCMAGDADYFDPVKEAVEKHSSDKNQDALRTKSAPINDVARVQNSVSYVEDEQNISEIEKDYQKERKRVEGLVGRGITFLQQNSVGESCRAFSHTKQFVDGPFYLFMYDQNGICFAHGQDDSNIWKNLFEMRDRFGTPIIRNVISKAREGGGWITYEWRNAAKLTYVKGIVKDGKFFAIGCGYHPHSKQSFCVNAVNGVVSLFEKMVNQEGRSAIDVWGVVTYPTGRFVYGDIELIVIDAKGKVYVHAMKPSLVNNNIIDERDDNGKYIYREMWKEMNKIKNLSQGKWFEFKDSKTIIRKYATRVRDDARGKVYLVSASYYPNIVEKDAVDFVFRGYSYMKSAGKSTAAEAFTEKRSGDFWYGYLHLIVYSYNDAAEETIRKRMVAATKGETVRDTGDEKAICVAHGGNETLIGQDGWLDTDQDGDFYVQEMIAKAIDLKDESKQTGGWINSRLRNNFASIFVVPISLGTKDNLLIATMLYPSGVEGIMKLLALSAAGYLEAIDTSALAGAFNAFNLPYGEFSRGDLGVFAFDTTGLVYTWETSTRLIWKNLIDVVDDNGKPFIKEMIERAKGGPTSVNYRQNGRDKSAYIIPVQKAGKTFIVGSSCYTEENGSNNSISQLTPSMHIPGIRKTRK